MKDLAFFENLSIFEVSFVNTYVARHTAYPMYNHGRAHSGLLFTKEGTEKYNFKDKSILAEPDSVIFIPKGEVYNIELLGEKSTVICIDFEFNNISNIRPFKIKISNSSSIIDLFSDTEAAWKKKIIGYKAECMSQFYNIVAKIEKQQYKALHPKNYHKIKSSVDYLHSHYTDKDFRIETLYRLSNLSPKYFNTLFYAHFSTTPKEYVTLLKMNLAKELIRSEKYSISEISQLLGYSDVYQFSKAFKKKVLISPTQYRNNK